MAVLNAETDVNTVAIFDLQGNVTADESNITTLITDVDLVELDISNMKSRLIALEAQNYEFNTELGPLASMDGRIKLVTSDILYFGDTLCKIDSGSGGTDLYIQFGKTTIIKHETDCETALSGSLITLDSATDETFNKGDILVLEQDFTNGFFWVEIFQEKN